ncbi:hypothetical protein HYPSUDRAFT_152053, partial [Hypholoma sublateritium FD-334 SS-4]
IHFPRFYKGEAFLPSLARLGHYQMTLRPRIRMPTVGASNGGPVREHAQFMDREIIGLNNKDFQMQRARKYTTKAGLEGQVLFVKDDVVKVSKQFGENSFDAVYVMVHAPPCGVCVGIFKALESEGVFGVYEWAMTDG